MFKSQEQQKFVEVPDSRVSLTRLTDTHLMWTPHYYGGTVRFVPGERKLSHFL